MTLEITDIFGNRVELQPRVELYSVRDFMGQEMPGLAIALDEIVDEPYGMEPYLPPKTKAVVDAIVDELAKDERVAAAYDLWNQMREEVCRTYTEHSPQRVPLSRQKEFKSVRNMVIREVRQLCRDEPPQHNVSQQGNLSSQTPGQTEQYREQSASAPSHHTSQWQSLTRPEVAGCVLNLFHNMGRIFREQSADDAVQQGLHIDRKRRRMLQEKRMALGHKADDHEDVPQLK